MQIDFRFGLKFFNFFFKKEGLASLSCFAHEPNHFQRHGDMMSELYIPLANSGSFGLARNGFQRHRAF